MNGQQYGRPPVENGVTIHGGGAQLDMSHIPQVNGPLAVLLEDEIHELFRIAEAACGPHLELEILLGRRRLADPSRGNLYVLLADGLEHLARSQIEGPQLLRVEPDAQVVIGLAETGDLADASDPG